MALQWWHESLQMTKKHFVIFVILEISYYYYTDGLAVGGFCFADIVITPKPSQATATATATATQQQPKATWLWV